MATCTIEPHLLESLQLGAREILETMVFLTPREIALAPVTATSFDDEVIGVLGFTGTRTGTFVVRATEDLAKLVAAKMLMMEPAELGAFAEAADAFGEVVNMLAGSFKNAWVAGGNQMELSMPNVIHRGRVAIPAAAEHGSKAHVRVALDAGALDIGVYFEARKGA